jgi:hypothetical protein
MAPYGWTCPCRKLKSDNIGDAVRRERRAPQFCHERLLRAQAAHPCPLQRGEVRSCDFNRMVLEFTMLNESKMILAVGAAVMDDLEGSCNVAPDQRVDQFARLREVIEVALSVLASDELFHVDLN